MPRYMGAAGGIGEQDLAWQYLPDDPFANLTILEVPARRHGVPGALAQAINWQISAAGIAEQDQIAVSRKKAQPSRDPIGHRLLVADIAGCDDFPMGIRRVDDIGRDH